MGVNPLSEDVTTPGIADDVRAIARSPDGDCWAKLAAVELGLRIATTLGITIEDDGCGLSQAAWLGSSGGLQSARHRVERLGGTIALQDGVRGTRFDIEIPRPLRLRANE